jgi:hypothetical protein
MKEAPQLPCACAWFEGRGEDGFGMESRGWGKGRFLKGCLKKSTFYYASKREKTNVVENSRKQKRVRAAAA